MLHALGFRTRREHRGHEIVRAYLANSGVDRVIHVAAQLRKLQGLRVKADYELYDPQPEDPVTVMAWIEEAKHLIATLDAVAVDPAACARMTAAIQVWERDRPPAAR